MIASRGMGDISPSKMPGGKKKARRDDTDFTQYAEGGPVGLYANIAAKKKRIAAGSGESMRSAGSAGAPKKSDFANAAKTTSYKNGGLAQQAATAIAMKEKGVKPKKMAEGGSTVNAAGNYTKPELRKRIFNSVKAEATAGTGAGQWSARKSQVLAKRYKAAGGGYRD
jgi:hypothetical protein